MQNKVISLDRETIKARVVRLDTFVATADSAGTSATLKMLQAAALEIKQNPDWNEVLHAMKELSSLDITPDNQEQIRMVLVKTDTAFKQLHSFVGEIRAKYCSSDAYDLPELMAQSGHSFSLFVDLHEKLHKIANYLYMLIEILEMPPAQAIDFLCRTKDSIGRKDDVRFIDRPVLIFRLYEKLINDIVDNYDPTLSESINMVDANGEPVETYMFLYGAHQVLKKNKAEAAAPALRELVSIR